MQRLYGFLGKSIGTLLPAFRASPRYFFGAFGSLVSALIQVVQCIPLTTEGFGKYLQVRGDFCAGFRMLRVERL